MSLMMACIKYTCHGEFTHFSGYTHIQCWPALCGIGLCGIGVNYVPNEIYDFIGGFYVNIREHN